MNRYFLYIAAAAALLTAACNRQGEEEDPVISVTGITHNLPATLELLVGATLTFEAAVEPAEATNQTVTWSTSDDQVETVSPAGEVIAVTTGTVTITATADDGKFTATCVVTVYETGVITMTTLAFEVEFIISKTGTGGVIIDWGDGETYASSSNGITISHSYSDASEHRITIAGSNIWSLYSWGNSLTTFDVNKYTALEYLHFGGNQLTSLDVSNNTMLRGLWVGSCPLSTLDVRNNTLLTLLNVSNCPLTTLDLSHNVALEDLYVSDNQLISLDVSNNTNLQTLICSDNQLTAAALNELFKTLPDIPEGERPWGCIVIDGNPGASDCDRSIAEEKRWKKWYFGPKSMENPEELNF